MKIMEVHNKNVNLPKILCLDSYYFISKFLIEENEKNSLFQYEFKKDNSSNISQDSEVKYIESLILKNYIRNESLYNQNGKMSFRFYPSDLIITKDKIVSKLKNLL